MKNKNYGLLGSGKTPADWVLGGEVQIGGEVLQPDGQWQEFIPAYEYQNTNFETMACVTFSACNCLEILHKRKYGVEINLSDRFTSKMSGTTANGNWMYNVIESLRKQHGLCYQDWWLNEGRTWNEWYAEIPVNIKGQSLKELNIYQINYEWISEPVTVQKLMEGLKYSPLQIAVYAYGNKVNGIYQRIEGHSPNHCVTLIGYKEGEYWEIFDHYLGNERRKLAWDYIIGFAMRFNINKINMTFYKELNSSAIYMLGADEKYHPIAYARYFTDLFGEFSNNEFKIVDIPDDKIGYPIGGYIN